MNILYVVSLYPCWSETFIVREINELRNRGHNVYIVSLKKQSENLIHNDAKDNIENVLYPGSMHVQMAQFFRYVLIKPLTMLSLIARLIAKFYKTPVALLKSIATILRTLSVVDGVRKLNIDHIHAHWATYPSTSALLLGQILGKKFSFTSHAHDIFLEDHLIKYKSDCSKFVATISSYNKNLLIGDYNVDEEKIKIIHCGIEMDNYQASDKNKNNVFLSVGRFDEIKGFKYLVEAANILVKRKINVKFEIIGDGELKNEIVEAIKKYSLDDTVSLLGSREQVFVREKMRQCKAFVLPCVQTNTGNMDGIPVVLMESMAMTTTVVSTYVSGIPELITNNVNGFLVDQKNSEQLANLLEEIIKNDVDPSIKRSARKKIESDFNIVHEVSKLECLMRS